MTFFEQFFSNTIFLTAAFGWLVAQVLKTLIHLLRSVWSAAAVCPVLTLLPYVPW